VSAIISANNGAHNWTARAYDAAGNVNTSLVVSLTVNIDTTLPEPTFGGLSVSGGQLQTTLSGLSVGETIVIYSSTDLKNWTPIKTNAVDGSTLSIANTINPAMNGQYFRAVVQ
jgi:hypothetical protein